MEMVAEEEKEDAGALNIEGPHVVLAEEVFRPIARKGNGWLF